MELGGLLSRWEIAEYVVLLTAVAALVGWCSLCLLLANFGSWNEIARRYPAPNRPHGRRFLMESVRFGGTFYPGCITIHVCEDGLYLSVFLPFRLGHPPIFIPVTAMHHYRTVRRFLVRRSIFDIGWPRICSVRLRRRVVQAIEGSAMGSGRSFASEPSGHNPDRS